MKSSKKQRFAFQKGDLKLKSKGADVSALQTILVALGYLKGSFSPGEVCRCTERAIRRYQRFYGLKVDGIVGPKTKAALEMPRCGVPDLPTNHQGASAAAPFVLRGCKYNKQNLTYAFLNGTSDLPGNRERSIVRQGFDAWANVTNLQFDEVQSGQNPDFRIAWRSGNHGDGNSFNGPGNTLAHAFFPPPCGGPNAGDLHFDEGEGWIENPAANGTLLLNVAIHEIGHLLGLSHSQDQSAIMFAFYSPQRASLAQDDIDGIQALYGPPSNVQELRLAAQADANLVRTGEDDQYVVEAPGFLAISVDGPPSADFDLYVRKGAPPTTSQWDFRAFTTSSDERLRIPVNAGEQLFVMVRSFSGAGNYKIRVEPTV